MSEERPSIRKKKEMVEKLKKYIASSSSYCIISLHNLPNRLLHKVRKLVRDKGGKVLVVKKAVAIRAIPSEKIVSSLKDESESFAIVVSDLSPMELNLSFRENKLKLAAKPGQVAPEDIVVEAGETDLPPGPALSEIKSVGIKAQIKSGKIVIAQDSTVVKAGEEIDEKKAKVLQLLGIKPFETWTKMRYASDGRYVYSEDLLNTTESDVLEGISKAYGLSNNLALNSNYPSSQTISYSVSEAFRQAVGLAREGMYSPYSMESLLGKASLEAKSFDVK